MNSFSGLHYVECFNMGYFQGGGKRPVYLLKKNKKMKTQYFFTFSFYINCCLVSKSSRNRKIGVCYYRQTSVRKEKKKRKKIRK